MHVQAESAVFITAGASGIGAACASLLAARGCSVFAGACTLGKGEMLKQQIGDALEEAILGTVDDAKFPTWNTIKFATAPLGEWVAAEQRVGGGGSPYPPAQIEAAPLCHTGHSTAQRTSILLLVAADESILS